MILDQNLLEACVFNSTANVIIRHHKPCDGRLNVMESNVEFQLAGLLNPSGPSAGHPDELRITYAADPRNHTVNKTEVSSC